MQILGGELVRNDLTKNAKGGSELMAERLHASLPNSLLKDFQIVLSREAELDPDKYRIYWAHDLAQDKQAAQVLANGRWKRFHRLVFVSYWQRQQFVDRYEIPLSHTNVLQNAIFPLTEERKKSDTIRFIYHTTPHRGLGILVPVFDFLCKHHSNIHLDVYSSFNVYGWPERDQEFAELFKVVEDHPKMTYHGSVSNEKVREALLQADIYAYPCVWPETSCLSLIEAMAAGLICVHSDLAVLPETAANWTQMYPYHENPEVHAEALARVLHSLLNQLNTDASMLEARSLIIRDYVNVFYDMNTRAKQWEALLESIKHEPRSTEPEPIEQDSGYFVYSA